MCIRDSARFECSDPLLERVHGVGRRTVTLNSDDAYTDCPTREQRAWTGDSVVHQMVDLTTNDDWRLARRNVALAAGARRPDGMLPMAVAGDAEDADFTIIPDWALHWVHSVWNLYRYVGDRNEIAELLNVVEGVLRWFEPFTDPKGLLRDVYGWVIIDWSSVHTDGASCALNGLFGRALLEFAEMASWLGDEGRAGWARDRHERLRDGFEAFWDPDRQRYVDSVVGERATDPGERRTASEHGQAAAIVGGVVPADRLARLVEALQAPDHRVSATFSVPDGPAAPNSGQPVGGDYLRAGHPEPWWEVDGLVVAHPGARITGEFPPVMIQGVVGRELIQLFTHQLHNQVVAGDTVEQDLVQLLQAVPSRFVRDGVVSFLREAGFVHFPSTRDLGPEDELSRLLIEGFQLVQDLDPPEYNLDPLTCLSRHGFRLL